ncbi:multimerin-2-like [Ostrea edulis]|uniref:multimerin-2-like n=1 Tax=Ostrea edulis TaxID=37623 RepID=UPI0024AE8D6B|nr:multimerin-2-like [Ostrea edulis]
MFCFHLSANVVSCRQEGENISAESTFQILLKRIEDQDKKIAAIETTAKADREDLERKNSILEEMIKRSDLRQKKLEKTIDDLKTEIFELLTGNVDTVKTSNVEEHSDKKQTVTIYERLHDYDKHNDAQSRQVGVPGKREQKRILTGGVSPNHAIAFYAYLSKGESVIQHHSVIFDTVITNVGVAYNHHDGVFTAPTNGVYVFNWNLYSSSHGDLVSELMVNSAQKGGRRSDSLRVEEDHSSSGTVVVQINQGDVVYVRMHPTASIAGFIVSSGNYQSSFSGWLLA